MKSIVEEASSIVKAIEKAWLRAGKPTSFQVKIFEEPQKNFFGLTIRSAKIGLFFAEGHEKTEKPKPEPRKEVRQLPKVQPKVVRDEQPVKKDFVAQKDFQKYRWTPELVKASQEWLNQTLDSMGYGGKRFRMDPKGYYLNILFDGHVLEDSSKELMLFKSLSHLMMQMLRTKFKKGFVGFKVVLKSA